MVSYEELIYHFTDIYMGSAMECSICKENCTMADDTSFLDEYMKIFVSLLNAVENDEELIIDTIKDTLSRRREDKLAEFRNFLQYTIAKQALEMAEDTIGDSGKSLNDCSVYIDNIQKMIEEIFTEDSQSLKEKPKELLRFVRDREESFLERV